MSLNNLANLYNNQGRYAEAEPLYQRSLTINEKAFGPEHPDVATSLSNLGLLYDNQGRYAEAEPLYKRSLAIKENFLGLEHPVVATTLNNLGLLYDNQGRYAEAEPLYQRSLTINEKAFGPEYPEVATTINNLANLYNYQGRYAEAEPLYKRSHTIYEQAFGPEHPNVAMSLNNLAYLYNYQGRFEEALVASRSSTDIYLKRFSEGFGELTKGARSEQQKISFSFLFHLDLLARSMQDASANTQKSLVSEGFETAQLTTLTRTASTLARLGARFAAGEGALAEAVRRYQDLFDRREVFEALVLKELNQTAKKRNEETIKNLRIQLDKIKSSLNKARERLEQEFPAYAELARPRPFSIAEVKNLLTPGEALLTYVVGDKQSYLWVIRPDLEKFLIVRGGECGTLQERCKLAPTT
jgi:tetratricopeptide (TPR) repeat protein